MKNERWMQSHVSTVAPPSAAACRAAVAASFSSVSALISCAHPNTFWSVSTLLSSASWRRVAAVEVRFAVNSVLSCVLLVAIFSSVSPRSSLAEAAIFWSVSAAEAAILWLVSQNYASQNRHQKKLDPSASKQRW
ncbi:hypothetical protein DFH27DRAFT_570397 [Peziza echinospora]|nr:hypothetical protein DFH27DRAFT_570397 [Peziza echinospora]